MLQAGLVLKDTTPPCALPWCISAGLCFGLRGVFVLEGENRTTVPSQADKHFCHWGRKRRVGTSGAFNLSPSQESVGVGGLSKPSQVSSSTAAARELGAQSHLLEPLLRISVFRPALPMGAAVPVGAAGTAWGSPPG